MLARSESDHLYLSLTLCHIEQMCAITDLVSQARLESARILLSVLISRFAPEVLIGPCLALDHCSCCLSYMLVSPLDVFGCVVVDCCLFRWYLLMILKIDMLV